MSAQKVCISTDHTNATYMQRITFHFSKQLPVLLSLFTYLKGALIIIG